MGDRDGEPSAQHDPAAVTPSAPARRLNPRKILVASVGVATLNYLGSACSSSSGSSVANLMAPPARDGAAGDAAGDGAIDGPVRDAAPRPPPTVANLLATPPAFTGKQ